MGDWKADPARGFVLEIPSNTAPPRLGLVLEVPVRPVRRELAPLAFNVISLGYPAPMRLDRSGLREAGIRAGANLLQADEIRVLRRGGGMRESAGARIWLDDADLRFRFWSGGPRGASADAFVLQPDEAAMAAGAEVVSETVVLRDGEFTEIAFTPQY